MAVSGKTPASGTTRGPLLPARALRVFAFAFFGWAFDFYDLALFGYMSKTVTQDLAVGEDGEAWILGAALGASGLGGIVFGALANRAGKRAMLATTILLYSLGSLVCGLAPSAWVLIVGRAIVGLGVGGEWAIGHGMVAEAVRPELRGRASAALQAGEPVGMALAAVVGFAVLPLVGWRWVFIGSSATALLALLARSSIHLPNERAPKAPSFRALKDAHVGKRMVLAWMLGVFKLGTYWTCYTWLRRFLEDEMHLEMGRSLAWVVTSQVGQLLGMLAFGLFADKVGRRPAFSVFSVLTAGALATLTFAWPWLLLHPVMFWLVMFLFGVGSGCTAGFGALLAELFPTEVRGAAMGTTYNLARGVQLLAPVLVHAMVVNYGISGGLGVPLVLSLATASWVWVLPETKGIVLPRLS